MGRPLRQPLSHLNNPSQPFGQVEGLVQRRPVLVEQRQDMIDDCALGFGEEVWIRKRGLRNMRAGIFAAEGMQDNRHREARREGGAF